MTPLKVSIAGAIASPVLPFIVFELIRPRRLLQRYALTWLLTAVLLLVLSAGGGEPEPHARRRAVPASTLRAEPGSGRSGTLTARTLIWSTRALRSCCLVLVTGHVLFECRLDMRADFLLLARLPIAVPVLNEAGEVPLHERVDLVTGHHPRAFGFTGRSV